MTLHLLNETAEWLETYIIGEPGPTPHIFRHHFLMPVLLFHPTLPPGQRLRQQYHSFHQYNFGQREQR